jgi:hypothetical protein
VKTKKYPPKLDRILPPAVILGEQAAKRTARAKHHDGVKTFAHGTHNLVRFIEILLPVIVGGLELRELSLRSRWTSLPFFHPVYGYAEASIFFFVIFVESWIWIMRARTRLALRVLDELTDRYGEKIAQSGV